VVSVRSSRQTMSHYACLKLEDANTKKPVRFQVLAAESMEFRLVFWDVLPCKIIVDRRFRGMYCLHHQGDE
jgi:hypothetical protein